MNNTFSWRYKLSILGSDWYCASPRVETDEDKTLNVIAQCEKHARTWRKELSPGFVAGIQACYAALMADEMWPVASEGVGSSTYTHPLGAGFYVGEDRGLVSIGRRRFLVPMLVPAGFKPKALRLAWNKDQGNVYDSSGINPTFHVRMKNLRIS